MSITEWISTVANVIMAMAAIFTAWLAWRALQTWKDQLRGQASYELARRLIRAVKAVESETRSILGFALVLISAHKSGEILFYHGDEFIQMARNTLEQYRKAQAELDDLLIDAEIMLPKDNLQTTRLIQLLSYGVYLNVEPYVLHFIDHKNRRLEKSELQEHEDRIHQHVREVESMTKQRIFGNVQNELKHYIRL